MVDHAEQIKIIIESLTSYKGDYYSLQTDISKVDEVLPKFLTIPNINKFNNSNVHYTEFFNIELQADSLENLETMIEDILGLATDAADGFGLGMGLTRTETFTIKTYTDDISRNLDESETEIQAGVKGTMYDQTPPGGVDDWYIFIRFVNQLRYTLPQGTQLTSGVLRITAVNNIGTATKPFIIKGYKGGTIPDPTNTLMAVWELGDTTVTYQNGDHAGNWDPNVEYTLDGSDSDSILDILQEVLDDAGFDGDFGFSMLHDVTEEDGPFEIYTKDVADSNSTKYAKLDLVWTEAWTDFPYWIEFTILRKPYNANKWQATIECEARWGL